MKFNIKDEKIVGYILLIVGLIIIAYSIVSVLGSASGGPPIELLQEDTTQGSVDGSDGEESFDISQMMTPLFPFFNMMAWVAISFFVMVAGGRVALLGIKLMKVPIPDTKIVKPSKEERKEV